MNYNYSLKKAREGVKHTHPNLDLGGRLAFRDLKLVKTIGYGSQTYYPDIMSGLPTSSLYLVVGSKSGTYSWHNTPDAATGCSPTTRINVDSVNDATPFLELTEFPSHVIVNLIANQGSAKLRFRNGSRGELYTYINIQLGPPGISIGPSSVPMLSCTQVLANCMNSTQAISPSVTYGDSTFTGGYIQVYSMEV